MSQTNNTDIKKIIKDPGLSAWRKYSQLTVGSTSVLCLARFELIYLFAAGLPGALGLLLRRLFYPFIFARLGRGVSFGRNVCLRGPGKIDIGADVSIDDNCVLDARGEHAHITIGDNVVISGGTVLRTRNGILQIGQGSSIGRNCLLGTDSRLILGEEVLLGAFTYLSAGAMHRYDGEENSIIRQGFTESAGISIGDGSWLGTRTTVLDGSSIGKGTVIGAHSLVNKSMPDRVVAYGCPAQIVKKR